MMHVHVLWHSKLSVSQRIHFLYFMDPRRVAEEGNGYSGLNPGQNAGVCVEEQ